MVSAEQLSFALSALLFVAFAANVILGAVGLGEVVGDVAEMLLLLGASIVFVVAILMRERRERGLRSPSDI